MTTTVLCLALINLFPPPFLWTIGHNAVPQEKYKGRAQMFRNIHGGDEKKSRKIQQL
jgi:hypothetical protein